MNMYKFGNYICKLREEKNLTQTELAKQLDVSDKSISKWENGQAFPRIETFEKLAFVLGTTVEDIFSASKDGIKRICVSNNFCYNMQLTVEGKPFSVEAEESKWIEIDENSDTVTLKITGEIITEEAYGEFEDLNKKPNIKEKIAFKFFKKATDTILNLVLQADCTYKLSGITDGTLVSVEFDAFDVGDKSLTMQEFQICYPKIVCDESIKVELLHAKSKNSAEVIKKYKKLGLASDLGLGFIPMLVFYPLRGVYFRHLCSPRSLKKNILKADEHKAKTESRKRVGCLGAVLSFVILFVAWFLLDALVFSVAFVSSERPYLVASDYSKITYYDSVYVRIDELPEYAYESTFLGATIWEKSRTDGLSKWDQSMQDDMVKLYQDDSGREYLWLVENYSDTIWAEKENGEDKDYEDFDEHYVYVCENP